MSLNTFTFFYRALEEGGTHRINQSPRRGEATDLHSIEASYPPTGDPLAEGGGSPAHSQAPPPAPREQVRQRLIEQGIQAQGNVRERRYDRLRKQGAVDFNGSTDPIEAETWLKRTQRVLNLMKCTL